MPFTTAATDVEADVTSDCVAREPELSEAPVSVRVTFVQTSAARVPNEVKCELSSSKLQ